MGSYYIPSNNLKGESRILYIFTAKSLIFTAVGAFIGLIFYFVFGMILGIPILGYIFIELFAIVGYVIATVKIPTGGNSKLAKNVGGDSIDDIIKRYILFKKNKKVYTYAVERQEPDYSSSLDSFSLDNIMGKVTGNQKNVTTKNNTKEEKWYGYSSNA